MTVIINQFSTRTTTNVSSTNIETFNLNNSDYILDSNFIDNNNNLVNNIVFNKSSLCKKVFKFLLGGRTLNENHNNGKEIPHEDDTPSGFLVRSLPKFLLYPRVSAIKKNVLVSLFLFTKYVIDHN